MKYKWLPFLLVIWTAGLLLAVLYAANNKVKLFDPENRLHQAALSTSFDDLFLAEINKSMPVTAGSVIHFQSKTCSCQMVAEGHINSVAQLAEQQQFHNITLNLDDHNGLKALIPSVPAIAVIDQSGKLSYLGPYSSGMFCAQGDGLVEPFIKKSQNSSIGATVISQSAGCYCHIAKI